jgi:hypothetical protein
MMKRIARWTIICCVAVLAIGHAAAQCNEPMDAVVKNMTIEGAALGNAWGCPTAGNSGSPYCGITYRFYTPDDTGDTRVNVGVDGNPIYVTGGSGSYRSDVDNSSNYFGGPHTCGKELFLVWDGELDPDTGDHRAFYGAQAQLINPGEFGNIFADCGGTTRAISCFAALGGLETADIPNTPQGTLVHTGGLSPVPVPLVESYDRVTGDIVLTWTAPENFHPNGEGETNPIVGVNLYLLEDTGLLDSRAVTSAELEAGARFVRRVDLPTATATLNDGNPDDVAPGTGSFIPVIKVTYQGTGDSADPLEGAFFGANGSVVLIDTALHAEISSFEARSLGKSRGYDAVEVSWATSLEENLDGFVLLRGTSLDGPFVAVTDLIPPRGQGGEGAVYSVVDTFRARGERQFFYMLEIHDADDTVRPHGPIRVVIESGNSQKPVKAPR